MKNSAKFEPTLLTIFGITGDLARQRLLPALYHLEKSGSLPKHLYIIGVSRRPLTPAGMAKVLKSQLKQTGKRLDRKVLRALTRRLHIANLEITQGGDYPQLKSFLDNLEDKYGLCFNRLFYLSIPPNLFAPVVEKLGSAQLHHGCTKHQSMESRIFIEKPFGYDLVSAKALLRRIDKYFKERQVYRIDHYLAKETAQNIITFRFENPLIDAVWNNQFIDHVQITVAEDIGIANRVNFFEQTGMLRDVVQSHILQLLALVGMERPASSSAADIHKARAQLLKAIKPTAPQQVRSVAVRGQYTAGKVGGRPVPSYRDEVSNPRSTVETYAAVKFEVNSPRWAQVPFIARAGKRLPTELTEITLVFKDRTQRKRPANTLTLRIDPDEGIILDLLAKKPGLVSETQPVEMDFRYSRSFSGAQLSAYERLLLNGLAGDRTLFTTSNEVTASWAAIQPILEVWQADAKGLEPYKAGTPGPKSADKLVERFGCEWLDLSGEPE